MNLGEGFEASPELRAMRETVRSFVRREVIPAESELPPDAVGVAPDVRLELQDKAKRSGLWCFGAPEEVGGAGLSLFAQAVLGEEAAQHRLGAYEPGLGAFGKEPPAILYGGTAAQIERYVRPTIDGTMSSFIAITEPSGGSDPARAIQTRAQLRGDRWVLNGQKVFITDVGVADYGVVFARTGGGRAGITAFLVDKDTPGLSYRPIPLIAAWHPFELFLDNVEVPVENVLGEVGQGFTIAQRWLVPNRVTYAAHVLGIGVAALRLAVDYAKIRHTFGSPLAEKQAIQWMIADSAIEIRAARMLIYDAAWRFDRQDPEARYASSAAKVAATETAGRVVDRAIQIHGAMGLTKELPLEQWYRDLRIKRIAEGPSEVHRMVVSRDLLAGRVEI